MVEYLAMVSQMMKYMAFGMFVMIPVFGVGISDIVERDRRKWLYRVFVTVWIFCLIIAIIAPTKDVVRELLK